MDLTGAVIALQTAVLQMAIAGMIVAKYVATYSYCFLYINNYTDTRAHNQGRTQMGWQGELSRTSCTTYVVNSK